MLDKNKITVLSTAIICIFFLTACTQTANYNKTDDTSSLLPVGSVVKVNDLGNMLIISIGKLIPITNYMTIRDVLIQKDAQEIRIYLTVMILYRLNIKAIIPKKK